MSSLRIFALSAVLAAAFVAAATSDFPSPQRNLILGPVAPPNLYGAIPHFSVPPADARSEVLYATRWGGKIYSSSGPSTDFRTHEGNIDIALVMSLARASRERLPAEYLELAGSEVNSVFVVRNFKSESDHVFRFLQKTTPESGLVTRSARPWRGHEILEYAPSQRSPTSTVIFLGGTDGATAHQALAVWASEGIRVVSLPWVQAGTKTPGCLDRIDLDIIEAQVRRLVEEFRPNGLVSLVGFSGGADAALMIASRMAGDFASVHAVSPTVWHFNGSRGFACLFASSPWTTHGRPVPYILNFPLRWTTPIALMRRWAGGLSQGTLAAEALSDASAKQLDISRYYLSAVDYPVYMYAGGLDDLTPSAASIESLCDEVPASHCYMNTRAGHDLFGAPSSPAYCISPTEALHRTDRRTYCIETARARSVVFNSVLSSLETDIPRADP